MDISNDLVMWTAIVSFLLPILTSLVQQPRWKQRTRAAVAVVASVIAGAGTVYFTTPDLFTNGTAMTTVILTVIVASTAAYNHTWKPLGIRKLEDATSPGDDTLEKEAAIMAALTDVIMDPPAPALGTIIPSDGAIPNPHLGE